MTRDMTIALAVVAGLIVVALFFYFRGGPSQNPDSAIPTLPGSVALEGGLIIQDVVVGKGAEARTGSVAVVHYVGRLENGTQFDSSLDRGEPFGFLLGSGHVIQGWERGILGMKVGGRRVLVIPASLGYGDRAVGPIPANSTLIFQVELLDVKEQAAR